jgi:hypothetical protein
MGRLLQAIYERQLDGEVTTTGEGIRVAEEMLADIKGKTHNDE